MSFNRSFLYFADGTIKTRDMQGLEKTVAAVEQADGAGINISSGNIRISADAPVAAHGGLLHGVDRPSKTVFSRRHLSPRRDTRTLGFRRRQFVSADEFMKRD
ncbi:hypothetical protein [Ensifer aridi]|uniref:hypothetical protein n=1 Tax=Ensifer aridi TaxID=1708715 RepID=UPI000A10E730|nr:hypothetical protein [Ensifer aridi]